MTPEVRRTGRRSVIVRAAAVPSPFPGIEADYHISLNARTKAISWTHVLRPNSLPVNEHPPVVALPSTTLPYTPQSRDSRFHPPFIARIEIKGIIRRLHTSHVLMKTISRDG
jgi:hypothetical protein